MVVWFVCCFLVVVWVWSVLVWVAARYCFVVLYVFMEGPWLLSLLFFPLDVCVVGDLLA